jgi:hypothetical protein
MSLKTRAITLSTSTDSSHKWVSHDCVLGMLNIEHLQHQINDLLFEFFARQASWAFSGDFRLQCEIERLTDREGWMMVFLLLAVHCLTPVALLKQITVEGAVQNITIDFGVSIALVTNYFKERSAPRARSAKHEDHFSRFRNTFEVLENVELSSLLANTENTLECLVDVEE